MPRRYSLKKRISWRLEYLGYRFTESLLQLIPASSIDRIGSTIGFLFYYLSRKYRHLAIRNLRIAFGEEKRLPEIRKLARATCQRTIANFLGTLKTTILPTSEIDRHVELEGLSSLHTELSKGKGAILVLGHMGNWEILNRLHQFLPAGTPAGGIYQRLKNPFVNAHMLKRREQDGSRLFDKKKGFHAPASFVKEGGLLIVVADQKTSKAGAPVPFFGRLSSLSPLPALLARKADAPVLAAGIETISPGKWRVVLQPFQGRPQTTDIISSLEGLIRRSPADYLWLHNRWKLNGHLPLAMGCKKTKNPPPSTKPLRLVLLTNQKPDCGQLQRYLKERPPVELPLACEFLWITNDPEEQKANTRFAIHQSISPTPEQLASQIREIDLSKTAPIELAILLTPSRSLADGLQLTNIPRYLINSKNLPLQDYLRSQTANLEQPDAPTDSK